MTIIGDNISVTPFFVGADPAEIPFTKYAGLRVLSKEEDYGLKLINSLSESQKTVATLSKKVPKDIITNPKHSGRINDYYGIKGSDLTETQKQLLIQLINEYITNLEHNKADEYQAKIDQTGVDNIFFAWIGSYERKAAHYYIINSTDFMIEYDNNGGIGNKANHIHTIWREKNNDFGEDLLKKHFLNHKH